MSQETFRSEFVGSTAKLAEIKPPPYLPDTKVPNLQYFMLNVFSRFALAAEAYGRGEDRRPPRFVVVVKGQPGDGKTYISEIIDEAILNWGSHPFRSGLLEKEAELWHSHVSWERDGLKAARDAGELRGNPNELAPDKGLVAANHHFQYAFKRSIRRSLFTTVEGPLGCVLKDPSKTDLTEKWDGRVMSTEAMRNFFILKDDFAGLEDEFNVEGYAVGLCGGAALEVLNDYRGLMKSVRKLNSGQMIANLFGRPIPRNIPELRRQQADGASPVQMRKIDDILSDLMERLVGDDVIVLPDLEKFREDHELPLREKIGLYRPMSTSMRYSTGVVLERVFKNDFRLASKTGEMPRYFVGLNDPPLESLGIDEDRQEILHKAYTGEYMLTIDSLIRLLGG